jgi:beta-lactamase class D
MPALFLALLLFGVAAVAQAQDAALAQLFGDAGVDGTLIIESAETGRRFVHNEVRAQRALPCASTFKVLHTLIALEEGVVAGADAPIVWDGTRHPFEDWNRDQTLSSAFRVSCVWCYQALARRVGADRYPAYIRRAGFGTLREPFDGTGFWLDGSLTVSAEQQVGFLKRVAARALPYRADSYDTLAAVMLAETGPGYRLYAKTGWAAAATPAVGWYVGYVETSDDVWLFALNIDIRGDADLPLRRQLALDALAAKKVL